MEVYFKKEWGFIHYEITAKDRKTLFFKKEVYREKNNDLLELTDFINIDINIKPCKSRKIAQWKFNHLCSLYTDEITEYLKIEDSNRVVDLIQQHL